MHIFRFSLFAAILLFACANIAFHPNQTYPKGLFRNPVAHTMALAGNFGELRPNHFHAGLDIKGEIGEQVMAAADGYVSKVQVLPRGYGKIVYVTHSNGYTTAYAHLNGFAPAIDKLVFAEQKKQEAFEVVVVPPKGSLYVHKGDVIAYLGMTGTTYGPHLHFEVRDNVTGDAINPLEFGFETDLQDHVPPTLSFLKVYETNHEGFTAKSLSFKVQKLSDNEFRVDNKNVDTLFVSTDYAGFAVKSFDQADCSANLFGIYGLEVYDNGELIYAFGMERFQYDDNRAVNAHIDYSERTKNNSYLHRCFKLPGNPLGIYKDVKNNGLVKLKKGEKAHRVEIIARDFSGNYSKVAFFIARNYKTVLNNFGKFPYYMPHNEDNMIRQEKFEIDFPFYAFYEPQFLTYYTSLPTSTDMFSDIVHVHRKGVPVSDNYTLRIKPNAMPKELKSSAVIVECSAAKPFALQSKWDGDFLVSRPRDFGNYTIMIDTIPPKITPIDIKPSMKGKESFQVKITDKVTGISRYKATLDGQWILLEYDAKNSMFTHKFENISNDKNHDLYIEVNDRVGNPKTYRVSFMR
jgi:hypothetical protein